MKKTGITNLPLHYGKAPRWLFQRMVNLSREIIIMMIEEFNQDEFIKKISDPYWFQSLGCVLGFDWHSSGVTTTVCGALKEAVKNIDNELGIYITGGKGKTSRKTPEEIMFKAGRITSSPEKLVYASKMVAKVDNTAVQDGFQLYQHNFIFTKDSWAVIQQGMDLNIRYARRYHWNSFDFDSFINEPHKAVCCDHIEKNTLNMVAEASKKSREISAEIACEKPEKIIREAEKIRELNLPNKHYIDSSDINTKYLHKILLQTYEEKPHDFENLLSMKGVGPKTIRALSLISELVYGVSPSYNDPARFSFAHGGKDGHPYPVDRVTYDKSIQTVRKAIYRTKIGNKDKENALKRLYKFYNE